MKKAFLLTVFMTAFSICGTVYAALSPHSAQAWASLDGPWLRTYNITGSTNGFIIYDLQRTNLYGIAVSVKCDYCSLYEGTDPDKWWFMDPVTDQWDPTIEGVLYSQTTSGGQVIQRRYKGYESNELINASYSASGEWVMLFRWGYSSPGDTNQWAFRFPPT